MGIRHSIRFIAIIACCSMVCITLAHCMQLASEAPHTMPSLQTIAFNALIPQLLHDKKLLETDPYTHPLLGSTTFSLLNQIHPVLNGCILRTTTARYALEILFPPQAMSLYKRLSSSPISALLYLSPNKLAIATLDGQLTIANLATGKASGRPILTTHITALAQLSDEILVAGTDRGTIQLWNIDTLTCLHDLENDPFPSMNSCRECCSSPIEIEYGLGITSLAALNHHVIITCSRNGYVTLLELEPIVWRKRLFVTSHQDIYTICKPFFQPRATLFRTYNLQASFQLWDTDRNVLLAMIANSPSVDDIFIPLPHNQAVWRDPESQALVIAHLNDNAKPAHTPIVLQKAHDSPITAIARMDNNCFVTGSENGTVIIWDTTLPDVSSYTPLQLLLMVMLGNNKVYNHNPHSIHPTWQKLIQKLPPSIQEALSHEPDVPVTQSCCCLIQ